jgi:hypothetical protein
MPHGNEHQVERGHDDHGRDQHGHDQHGGNSQGGQGHGQGTEPPVDDCAAAEAARVALIAQYRIPGRRYDILKGVALLINPDRVSAMTDAELTQAFKPIIVASLPVSGGAVGQDSLGGLLASGICGTDGVLTTPRGTTMLRDIAAQTKVSREISTD